MVEIQYGGHLIHKMALPFGRTEYPSKPIYFLYTKPSNYKVGCSECGDTRSCITLSVTDKISHERAARMRYFVCHTKCVQLLVSPYESTSYFYTVLTLHFEKL